jgi:hypothetical protein
MATFANVLGGGQVNSAGDRKALFLKVYGGEVLTAFEEMTRFKDRHFIRTISNGKSAQFPVTWKVGASYHTPGAEIDGQTANNNERTINVDDLLISPVFFANIEEAMSHYDYRSEYTKQAGIALANQFDKNVAQVGVLAARAAATVTGGFGGASLTNAAFNTDSTALANGLWSAAQTLDEKDVPETDRAAFFRPAQYYLLTQNVALLNQEYGGVGSISEGNIPKLAGIEIIKTNRLPSTNVNTGPTAYQGNFSNTFGLVMNKMAVGTVKLMDLAVEEEYSARHQGTLVVAKYAVGHGILRPDCAVELKTA